MYQRFGATTTATVHGNDNNYYNSDQLADKLAVAASWG